MESLLFFKLSVRHVHASTHTRRNACTHLHMHTHTYVHPHTHTQRTPAMAVLSIFILGFKLLFPLLFLTHSLDVWSCEAKSVGAIGGGGQRTPRES